MSLSENDFPQQNERHKINDDYTTMEYFASVPKIVSFVEFISQSSTMVHMFMLNTGDVFQHSEVVRNFVVWQIPYPFHNLPGFRIKPFVG